MGAFRGGVRVAAAAVAVVAVVVVHFALTTGYGVNVALVASAAQAVAAGVIVRPLLRGRAVLLAPGLSALLLGAHAVGASWSPEIGLLLATGVGHAVLYGALLAVFGASLRPGRVAVVTRLARRINPHFHAGMVPYTRAVTLTWCLFFAAQLGLSAVLLLVAPVGWWLFFVGTLQGPLALGLAIAEFGVRCWRFPGQHTDFRTMVRGVRAGAPIAGADTSSSAADCPGRTDNATRHPPRPADTAPGPAA